MSLNNQTQSPQNPISTICSNKAISLVFKTGNLCSEENDRRALKVFKISALLYGEGTAGMPGWGRGSLAGKGSHQTAPSPEPLCPQGSGESPPPPTHPSIPGGSGWHPLPALLPTALRGDARPLSPNTGTRCSSSLPSRCTASACLLPSPPRCQAGDLKAVPTSSPPHRAPPGPSPFLPFRPPPPFPIYTPTPHRGLASIRTPAAQASLRRLGARTGRGPSA